MNPNALAQVRRVVTENGPNGNSRVQSDGPSPATRTVADRPGFRSDNVWRTVGGPTPVKGGDTVLEHSGVMPPQGGTVLRVIDFPPRPKDPEERRRQASASLRALFPDAQHEDDHAKPGMHVTQTVDYAIVLHGTITAVLDDEETDLCAGDILIQRATNHGWENRTEAMVRVAFVLVDGCSS